MSKETQAITEDVNQLAHHARALVVATAGVANDQVADAREKLSAVLESGRHMTELMRDRLIDGSKCCRDTMREHPYQTLGVALGVGMLIGLCFIQRCHIRVDHKAS